MLLLWDSDQANKQAEKRVACHCQWNLGVRTVMQCTKSETIYTYWRARVPIGDHAPLYGIPVAGQFIYKHQLLRGVIFGDENLVRRHSLQ